MANENVTRALVAAVSKSQAVPNFMLGFFGTVVLKNTRFVDIQTFLRKARVATFTNPIAVADGTEKLSFNQDPFVLPTIQDVQTITGEDLENIVLGDNEYTPKTPEEKLGYCIAKTVEDQRGMVSLKNEVSAIEAAFDGKITVLGKGENRVIDFGRPAALTVDIGSADATLYWSGANADPDKDIDDTLQLMADYGSVATDIIGRPATVRTLLKVTEIKANLDNRRVEIGNETFHSMLKERGVIYYGTYKELNLWGYNGRYVDAAGVTQNAVPDKKVVFAAGNNGNVTVNGYAPDVGTLLNDGASTSTRDARNYVSSVIPGRKALEIEAVQTTAPMLADVGSMACVTVLP